VAQPDPSTHPVGRRWLVRLTVLALVGGALVAAVQGGVAQRLVPGLEQRDAAGVLDNAEDGLGTRPAGPAPDEEAGPATAAQEQQALLVEAEDDRLLSIVSDSPDGAGPYEVTGTGRALPTVVLTGRSRPYDLAALQRLGAVERQADGAWLLQRSVVVARDAELRIQAPGAVLRLVSGADGFASLVAFKGTLVLSGGPDAPLSITSWDPDTGAADTATADGRAYLRAVGARMELNRVNAADLGFWSGRTGGVAWTGSAGAPATGSATGTIVERSHYGLFTSRTTGLAVDDTTLRNNELDGMLLHRETSGITVHRVASTGNGRDGVAIVRGAEGIALSGITASGNTANGIRIDGSPLAAGATAGGASTAAGEGYTVERSTATDNVEVGILVVQAAGLRLVRNTVAGNRDGIVLRGPAERPELIANTVDADEFGIAVRDGTTDARLTGNRIGASVIGIQVADASATIRENTVTDASRYGVSLVGEITGSAVGANSLAGRGLAAVDVNRVAATATADISGNDESGWTVDRDDLQYWRSYVVEHPLLLLWLLILTLPLAARLWAKRRHRLRDDHEHPYRNVAPGPFPAGGSSAVTSLGPDAPAPPARRTAPRPAPAARRDETSPAVTEPTAAEVPVTVALPVTRVTVVSGQGARR
jgi:hypothetical protein